MFHDSSCFQAQNLRLTVWRRIKAFSLKQQNASGSKQSSSGFSVHTWRCHCLESAIAKGSFVLSESRSSVLGPNYLKSVSSVYGTGIGFQKIFSFFWSRYWNRPRPQFLWTLDFELCSLHCVFHGCCRLKYTKTLLASLQQKIELFHFFRETSKEIDLVCWKCDPLGNDDELHLIHFQ